MLIVGSNTFDWVLTGCNTAFELIILAGSRGGDDETNETNRAQQHRPDHGVCVQSARIL